MAETANTTQTMIDIQNVSVGYGDTDVLSNIKLSLNAGSFTFITGKSGAGKTTLIRTIMGTSGKQL
jgi:ABC-type Mn2+/Zn2+ transport system ATPase subunit